MPELPEVETVRRGLELAVTGRKIMRVDKRRAGLRVPFPDDFENLVEGRKIAKLSRRAKYLLIHLDDGQALIIHLGMSGRILMIKPDEAYEIARHDHLIFELDNGLRVIMNDPRRFGMVYLVPAEALPAHPALAVLGPEPLGNQFAGPVLHQALAGRTMSIKAALMDQRIIAGLGNIYVCEALHEAGISPLRSAGSLSPAEAERLVQAIRNVLARAIAAGGSSLKDYRQADGALGYFQHQFAVYDRAGQSCQYCRCEQGKDNDIQKITQQGRSTFYCPAHQI